MRPLSSRPSVFLSACATLALAASPALAGGGAVCGSQARADIVDTAVKAGAFQTLAAALGEAGLVDALKGDGPFTVFAPTDDAFAQLPEGTLASLLEPANRSTLRAILTYHVVPGRVTASQAQTLSHATTLNGQRLDITSEHGVRVDGATVTKADIACSNGVIHVIDRVILPSTQGILETAAAAGSFSTLATAIKTAGLVKALSGEGPFTVFAPTDAAFAKLPAGTIEALLAPEGRAKLVEILQLHVVSGRIYADQALEAGSATTLAGTALSIGVEDGVARVSGSRIVKTDVEAANGVIHVIDQVILPEATETSQRSCPARALIETAQERAGQLDELGAAAVYELALRSLVALGGERVPAQLRVRMREALACPQRSACSLNSALGEVAQALDAAVAEPGTGHASPAAASTPSRTYF